MRQNLVVVLLSVCSTLLVVNLFMILGQPQQAAFGQAAALPTGSVAIATVQDTSNSPWCFVYDVSSQRLVAYKAGNQGLELKGARQITWDLKIEELSAKLAQMGRVPVSVVKGELGKSGGGGGGTDKKGKGTGGTEKEGKGEGE